MCACDCVCVCVCVCVLGGQSFFFFLSSTDCLLEHNTLHRYHHNKTCIISKVECVMFVPVLRWDVSVPFECVCVFEYVYNFNSI